MSGAGQKMSILAVKHGEPFFLIGKHLMVAEVGDRFVALYWLGEQDRVKFIAEMKHAKPAKVDLTKANLVYVDEIDSSYVSSSSAASSSGQTTSSTPAASSMSSASGDDGG